MKTGRMKLLFTLLALTQTLAAGAVAESDTDSFERLIYYNSPAGSDVLPLREDPTELPRWKARMAQFQDANERLLRIVNRDFLVLKESQKLGLSLFALSTREDLTPDQLERLTTLLDGMKQQNLEWTALEKQFICGALPVLQHYPSPKHEALAARFAEDADPVIALNAIYTLSEIGTKNSLVAAQNAVKRRYATFPRATDRLTKKLEAAVDKFVKRVASLESAPKPLNTKELANLIKPPDQADSDPYFSSDTNEESHFQLLVWAAVAFSVFGLLWLWLREGSKRSGGDN